MLTVLFVVAAIVLGLLVGFIKVRRGGEGGRDWYISVGVDEDDDR